MQLLSSVDEFEAFIAEHGGAIVYFGGVGCGVCEVLRPRIAELAASRFPLLARGYVETSSSTELAGQQRVFSIPTVIAFFDGRELLRRTRNFAPAELAAELERPYQLFFG